MNSIKILIIDDDPQVRQAVGKFLKSNGFEVQVASGGKEGITMAQNNKPDLIICDLNMPEFDGQQVVKELRIHPEFLDLPVVYLSATHEGKTIRQCMNVGGDDYLTKPSSPDEILETINARLLIRKRKRELSERITKQAVSDFVNIINDLDQSGIKPEWSNYNTNVDSINLEQLFADLNQLSQINQTTESPKNLNSLIYLKGRDRKEFVKLSEIIAFIANGEYSIVCWGNNRKVLFRKAIKAWIQELPQSYFIRIHRCCIINLNFLDHVSKNSLGHQVVKLNGLDDSFAVSQRERSNFNRKLLAYADQKVGKHVTLSESKAIREANPSI